MAYTSWSVVFGEQPSAAKWNILGTNDASFNDGTGIADGVIKPEHLMNGSSTLNTWAWDSWTPTLSGRFDDGDWTKDCKYIQIGKKVFFRLHLTATAAAPMGGGVAEVFFTLPVTAAAIHGTSTNVPLGTVHMQDTGTATYLGAVYTASSTTLGTARYLGATSVFTGISSTAPFTWTTNDLFVAVGTYEAA